MKGAGRGKQFSPVLPGTVKSRQPDDRYLHPFYMDLPLNAFEEYNLMRIIAPLSILGNHYLTVFKMQC